MSAISVNQLIKQTIDQNKFSKSRLASATGISKRRIDSILKADDIFLSDLFLLCNAMGTKIVIEFSGGDQIVRFPLIKVTPDEQD